MRELVQRELAQDAADRGQAAGGIGQPVSRHLRRAHFHGPELGHLKDAAAAADSGGPVEDGAGGGGADERCNDECWHHQYDRTGRAN